MTLTFFKKMPATRPLLGASAALLTILLLTGCERSAGQMLEDTKTASHYSAKAIRSLGGKHGESRQVESERDFGWEQDQEERANSAPKEHIAALDASDAPSKQALKTSSKKQAFSMPHYEKFTSAPGELAQVFQNIHFDTNDDEIRGKANIARVLRIAKLLKERPDIALYIEGHCDRRGTASYNLSLGSRRAASIKTMLVKEGANKERIACVSFGKERPLRAGDSETAWAENRRGQFKVYFK